MKKQHIFGILVSLTLGANSLVFAQTSPANGAAQDTELAAQKTLVVQQAEGAGTLAAVMQKCALTPDAATSRALRDYREAVVSLGEDAGITEAELDALVEAQRVKTASALPNPTPAEVCDAAKQRMADIVKNYSLFRMQPPELK